jgi:hypothetical protein
MDSIAELLGKFDHSEPPEISAIKKYIRAQFQAEVGVALHPNTIVITVRSASLAGAIRMHLLDIQKNAQTDKKLIIRIGR